MRSGMSVQLMNLKILDIHMKKNEIGPLCYTIRKYQLKINENLNTRPESVKLLQKNTEWVEVQGNLIYAHRLPKNKKQEIYGKYTQNQWNASKLWFFFLAWPKIAANKRKTQHVKKKTQELQHGKGGNEPINNEKVFFIQGGHHEESFIWKRLLHGMHKKLMLLRSKTCKTK